MTDFVAIEQALLDLQADITAQQATVQALIDAVNSDKGAALGTATLDANSRLQPAQHPALTSGQAYIGSAGNVPVAENLISAIASRSTNSANEPLILDGSALVSLDNIPSSIKTGATFKGTWDANTNTPTLTSGVGTNGDWYYVSVAGTTNLDGLADWQKGDIVIFNGDATAYEKIDGSDAVISVQADGGTPKQGTVSLSLNEFNLALDNFIAGNGSGKAQAFPISSKLVDLTSNQTINGTKIFTGLVAANLTLSSTTINDDDVFLVGTADNRRGFLFIAGNTEPNKDLSGIACLRTFLAGSGNSFMTGIAGFTGTVNLLRATTLTGTTGSDGFITISENLGNIYIENRTGAPIGLNYYTVLTYS